MNTNNQLFIFATILIFVVTISINYPAIDDYYKYTLPLNTLIPSPNFFEDNQNRFQEIYNEEGSECFTTPNENLFCYKKPKGNPSDGVLISYVIGQNGIDGEMHFDPVENGAFYFLMLNLTKDKDDSAIITFADKGYKIGADSHASLSGSFEFSSKIEPFDTFVSHCSTGEGKSVTIVQYLGTKMVDGKEYFVTWHMPANSETGVTCDYPELIQYSLNHNFKEL